MNIKDYLHFYLGQPCMCYNHADSAGWKETISEATLIEYSDVDSEIEGIVPILRPLSDMTSEEVIKWKSINNATQSPNLKQMAEELRWMLSEGFDLFGLIDAGLAIDKTKL